MCFPNALVGQDGYLFTHQKCIRKLAPITEGGGGSCESVVLYKGESMSIDCLSI